MKWSWIHGGSAAGPARDPATCGSVAGPDRDQVTCGSGEDDRVFAEAPTVAQGTVAQDIARGLLNDVLSIAKAWYARRVFLHT